MRNIAVNDVDDLPRRVLALGSDYPANTQLERHSHRRAQFLYAMNGLMKVETDDGQWLVPLQRRVDPGHPSASGTDAGGQHPQPVHRTGCGAACRRTLRGVAGLSPVTSAAAERLPATAALPRRRT